MIKKGFDKKGNKFYYNAFTGNKVNLPLGRPLSGGRIPDGILGTYIKPTPTALQISIDNL